jgi:hypothetical protein
MKVDTGERGPNLTHKWAMEKDVNVPWSNVIFQLLNAVAFSE